jgi:signal transduction histidine kinase
LKHRRSPLLANLVLALSVALLAAVAAWSTGFNGVHPSEDSLHLTEADWQATDAANFQPPPPTQDSHALPAAWRHAVLPHALDVKPIAGPLAAGTVRTTWIRLSVPGRSTGAGALAIYGVRVKTDGTVAIYANGRLVHRAQQQGPLWNSLFTPLWIVLERGADDPPVTELLVRLEHDARNPVALSSLWLGPPEALHGRYLARQWLQQRLPEMLSASFLAVGVFALFIWLRRRHEIGYLLFFNLAATSFAGHLHYVASVPITSDWFAWLTLNALFWLITAVHLFLCQLHGRPLAWMTRVVVGVTTLITVTTVPDLAFLPVSPSAQVITPAIYAIAVLMGAAVGVVGGVCAWRRSGEGRLVAVGVGLCVLLGVPDWLLHNNVVNCEGWFLGAYTNAVTFAMFAILMYRRYVGAIVDVERANANLELRLRSREAELELIHHQLREVALRQSISDERQRLMQDMHDGLGSSLISAIRSVERGGIGELKVAQVLKDCLDDLKLTIDSMEPVEADLLLLLATLRFRLEPRLEGTGVALSWEVQELPTLAWLDPSSALHILRIVQESVANILRHTRATEIRVATERDALGVTVTIVDNGQGFDVERALAQTTGRGLHNQQRRAHAVAGSVSWTSSSLGTRFMLWLPLARATPVN